MAAPDIPQVHYTNAEPTWPNNYVWPVLIAALRNLALEDKRAFDVGCGNGATANLLHGMGFEVTAVDPSVDGLTLAKAHFPHVSFHAGDGYEPLARKFGTFPLVVCLEVIEHCFAPRALARTLFDLLVPGGTAIISTPFHGYWKNLVMALGNKWDPHLDPLWDGGHIKFFSEQSLRTLLEEIGFTNVRFHRAGRIYPLAKSMIAVADRPKVNASR